MNDYAVLGDPQTCKYLWQALKKQGLPVLDEGNLMIQDEWECRRWFARNQIAGVFICTGLLGGTSVSNFMFTVAGSLSVIRAAADNVPRLMLVSHFPTAEFSLFQRLLGLYANERHLDFQSMSPGIKESVGAFADRCVLSMSHVSSEKAHQTGTEGPHQAGEMRHALVPQSAGDQGHTPSDGQRHGEGILQPAPSLLEMPVQTAQGTAPGDVCAQLVAANG